jgi:hypothetical protein
MAQVPALSMSEAGLKTQAIKNRVYVPPSARAGWAAFLEANPRPVDPTVLCLHDIPDGRLPPPTESDDAFYIHEILGPSWPENDGINILGTPLGSLVFVEGYLNKKLEKHETLLSFIVDVAKMGYPREVHKMLTGSAVNRLTHILKSVPKDQASTNWMEFMNIGSMRSGLSLGSGVVEGVAFVLRVEVRTVVDVEGMEGTAREPPAAISGVTGRHAALHTVVIRVALGITFRHGTGDGGGGF